MTEFDSGIDVQSGVLPWWCDAARTASGQSLLQNESLEPTV
jgi:hypothetical protein